MMGASTFNSLSDLSWMELLALVPAGILLGLLYFSSVWFSTGKLLQSPHPLRWLLCSAVLRLALLLPALYWLTEARWQNLLACLGGFLVGRILVLRLSAAWHLPERRQTSTRTAHVEAISLNTEGIKREHSHAP